MRLAVRTFLQSEPYRCRENCRVVQVGTHAGQPLMVLLNQRMGDPTFLTYDQQEETVSVMVIRHGTLIDQKAFEVPENNDGSTVELRPFQGQQLFIDGEPASGAFE